MLAKLPFRTMSLQDRGLLYTMRLECWENERLPNSPNDLAKIFGVPVAEISSSLAAVMPFFEVVGDFIVCPELDDYRAHLADRQEKQREGGKKGAAKTNSGSKQVANAGDDEVSSTPSSNSRVTVKSLVESSAAKQSQEQSLENGVVADQFLKEYEAAEKCTAEEYARLTGRG